MRLIGDGRERYLMTAEDREKFRALPERFKVYRGAKPWNIPGLSWTTDVDRACTFAMHTHDGAFPVSLSREHGGCVYERLLRKCDVLFYTNARTEDEIITRRFLRGSLSPMGAISLALYDGPEAGLAEYELQKSKLDPEALAELTPEVLAFWRASSSAKVRSAKAKAKRKDAS
ncbi:MAG: hypothetical protein JWO19_4491 [Bryobacterales bacterium]|nr:hypothetical protein [Bryobacterales bacterium]